MHLLTCSAHTISHSKAWRASSWLHQKQCHEMSYEMSWVPCVTTSIHCLPGAELALRSWLAANRLFCEQWELWLKGRSSVWLHSRGLEAHFSMLQQVRSNAILWLYVSSDWCSSAEIWYVLHYVDLKQGLDPISLRSPGLSVHVKLVSNQVLSANFLLQPVQGYII